MSPANTVQQRAIEVWIDL